MTESFEPKKIPEYTEEQKKELLTRVGFLYKSFSLEEQIERQKLVKEKLAEKGIPVVQYALWHKLIGSGGIFPSFDTEDHDIELAIDEFFTK